MSSPGFIAIDETIVTARAVSPEDQLSDIILGVAWLGSLYVVGMIWTTLALVDRWKGPNGKSSIGFFSVIAAFVISSGWPVVLLLLAVS